MTKFKKISILFAIIVSSGFLIYGVSTQTAFSTSKNGVATNFPAQIDFAGESTPLNISDVRERLDRELVVNENYHSATILIMKRANRVFPVIEPILKQYGVPDDFKYLAVAESALTNAISSAGAKGVWQFMPQTAREKGLEVNDNIDERYHLQKSTEAACKYLIESKNKLGTWTLAAAAYNGGNAGVNRQIESQKVQSYYDLLLNDETSRYVFRILSLKAIMENPAKYHFNLEPSELYSDIPTKRLQIDSTITDLAQFSIDQGINYKILKLHNPWLRESKLENASGKIYYIDIPTSGY